MARSEEVPQEVPSLPTGSTSISDTYISRISAAYRTHIKHISDTYRGHISIRSLGHILKHVGRMC